MHAIRVGGVKVEEAHDFTQNCVIGIDVGGSFTKMGAFTMQGQQIASHVFVSPQVFDDCAHPLLAQRMFPLLEQLGGNASNVLAVGLALPGAVTDADSLEFCPNLDVDMPSYKAFLHAYFPRAQVVALNDADAAVLGDRWQGSSSKAACNKVILVT